MRRITEYTVVGLLILMTGAFINTRMNLDECENKPPIVVMSKDTDIPPPPPLLILMDGLKHINATNTMVKDSMSE